MKAPVKVAANHGMHFSLLTSCENTLSLSQRNVVDVRNTGAGLDLDMQFGSGSVMPISRKTMNGFFSCSVPCLAWCLTFPPCD